MHILTDKSTVWGVVTIINDIPLVPITVELYSLVAVDIVKE